MRATRFEWIQTLRTELNTPAWKRSLILWLALNLLLSGLGALAWKLHNPIRPADPVVYWGSAPIDDGLPGALEGVWLRWDAIHYYHIAQEGYSTEVVSAFFPLYPLLGRAAGRLLGGDDLAGLLLVSRLAFLLALVALYKMTARRFGDEVATFAIVFTAIYPMGVYWFAPYPLSLALFFTLLSLHWAMQKHWAAAALAGLAAGLTHGTSVPLTLGLLAAWFLQVRKEPRAWLLLPAVASPLLGTAVFFAWRIRAGLPPINEVLATFFLRVMQPPWMVYREFSLFFTYAIDRLDGWINMALFLLAVCLLVVCIRKLELPLWLYQLGLIVYVGSTTNNYAPFGSYGRYLMMAFPGFIILPIMIQGKRPRLYLAGLSLLIMGLMSIAYFEWGWLA